MLKQPPPIASMAPALLIAFVFASGWNLVVAHTSVKCRADFKWAENSLGQNPCTMAAYLRSACNPDENFVRTLPRGSHYTGPSSPSKLDPCWCSSVTYSLYAACEVCQGRSASALPTWDEWTANCETVDTSNGTFPRDIPAGTVIPAWAYGSYSLGQPFVPGNAEESASGNYPESTPAPAATGSSSIGAPTTDGSASTSPYAGPSPSGRGTNPPGTMDPSGTGSEGAQAESGSGTNKGAIIGGVIGGVVGLLLLLLLAFCCLRRRKQKKRADVERDQSGGDQHILNPPRPGGLPKHPASRNGDGDDDDDDYDEKNPATGTTPSAPGPSNTSGNYRSANSGRGGGNQGDDSDKEQLRPNKGNEGNKSANTKPGLFGRFKRRPNAEDSIQKDNTTGGQSADSQRTQVLKAAEINSDKERILNQKPSQLPKDPSAPPPNPPDQPPPSPKP